MKLQQNQPQTSIQLFVVLEQHHYHPQPLLLPQYIHIHHQGLNLEYEQYEKHLCIEGQDERI